jgi:hypothetical protein
MIYRNGLKEKFVEYSLLQANSTMPNDLKDISPKGQEIPNANGLSSVNLLPNPKFFVFN